MTEFFGKKKLATAVAAKPASKTTAARKVSGSTKPAPKKAPVKVAESSDDELLMDEDGPESAPVAPRAAAPRRAAAKTAYIELSDDDDDDDDDEYSLLLHMDDVSSLLVHDLWNFLLAESLTSTETMMLGVTTCYVYVWAALASLKLEHIAPGLPLQEVCSVAA
jgi:hypothetical protein